MQEEKIKKIREAVIAANGDIMKLQFGCHFTLSRGRKVDRYIYDDYRWTFDDGLLVEKDDDTYDATWTVEILGRKIGLCDVLVTLAKNLGDKRPEIVTYTISSANFVDRKPWTPSWNLLNDDLTHQSEPTIDFLYDLFITKVIK